MHLLRGEGVTRHFGGLAAVTDVGFHVDQGEILGLIGPNGAGKTTLFNLISASLKPTRGKIWFNDKEITGLPAFKICRLGIARTFQTVKIFPDVSVVRNVMVGSLFGTGGRISEKEAFKRAEAELTFVKLDRLADLPAGDLTLANQKRLEVARALATGPQLLLLDELMAGLTRPEIDEAMNDIRAINARGTTVIMIEHVMHAIMNICSRIMVLDHGLKIAEGEPEEIAVNQQVIECYLGRDTSGGEDTEGDDNA